MRIKIPFGLHAYESRSGPVNDQELVNMFAEVQQQDGKDKVVTFGFPGTTSYATAGTGPIHGMKVMGDYLYVVSGTSLYRVQNGTATLIGSVPGGVRASIEHSGSELCTVNGVNGYTYSVANGLQQITSAGFYNGTERVAYLERRFLHPRKDTIQFYASNAFDGQTYDALNFEQTLTDPENNRSMIADHGEVWIFTKKGAEVWTYNRNEASFPYSRIDGAYVEKGIAATHAIGKVDNTFFWLGEDRVIYRADGYKPTRISTHAIEKVIGGYTTISDAFCLTYQIGGHSFVEFTFPTENQTWRYDAATGLWHEAKYNSGRYHANATEFFENKTIIGDYQNGNLYYLDFDSYTDNGTTITRVASTPQINHNRARAVMDRLYIDIESGPGLTTGQGSDPQMLLKYSKDGGKTWSNEKWLPMGKVGEYTRRVKVDNIGMYYQIMFKMTISDPVKVVSIDAYADVEIDDSH